MPKIQTTDATKGCTVRGEWRQANGAPVVNGELTFAPQHGGLWQGRVISERYIAAATDKDGRFAVTLVPSSVVGPYTVTMGGQQFVIDVPDSSAAVMAGIIAR